MDILLLIVSCCQLVLEPTGKTATYRFEKNILAFNSYRGLLANCRYYFHSFFTLILLTKIACSLEQKVKFLDYFRLSTNNRFSAFCVPSRDSTRVTIKSPPRA